jgi:hypothetical protein
VGEFFKGWRRKTGLVVLAMAMLPTVGWVRSYVIRDTVSVRYQMSCHIVMSVDGGIGWVNLPTATRDDGIHFSSNRIHRGGSHWADFDVERRSDWWGFSNGKATFLAQSRNPIIIAIWIAPYWSLVLPLTLLSAWLILWKPRKVNGGQI